MRGRQRRRARCARQQLCCVLAHVAQQRQRSARGALLRAACRARPMCVRVAHVARSARRQCARVDARANICATRSAPATMLPVRVARWRASLRHEKSIQDCHARFTNVAAPRAAARAACRERYGDAAIYSEAPGCRFSQRSDPPCLAPRCRGMFKAEAFYARSAPRRWRCAAARARCSATLPLYSVWRRAHNAARQRVCRVLRQNSARGSDGMVLHARARTSARVRGMRAVLRARSPERRACPQRGSSSTALARSNASPERAAAASAASSSAAGAGRPPSDERSAGNGEGYVVARRQREAIQKCEMQRATPRRYGRRPPRNGGNLPRRQQAARVRVRVCVARRAA